MEVRQKFNCVGINMLELLYVCRIGAVIDSTPSCSNIVKMLIDMNEHLRLS